MPKNELRSQIEANIENIDHILGRIEPWYEGISQFTARSGGSSVHFKRSKKRKSVGDIDAEAFWLLNGPRMIGEVKETLERVLREVEIPEAKDSMDEARLNEIEASNEEAMIDGIRLGIALQSDHLFKAPSHVSELLGEVRRLRGV